MTTAPQGETIRTPGRATQNGGLLWGAVFTLGPYLLAAIGLLLWSLAQDLPLVGHCDRFDLVCARSGTLIVLAFTAPFAVLATGVAWMVVLLMGRAPARFWPAPVQGAIAAVLVYGAAAAFIVLHLGPVAADAINAYFSPR